MRILLRCNLLLCLQLLLALLPFCAGAGEGFYLPPKPDLPDVLFSFPGGQVSRNDLVQATLRASQPSEAGMRSPWKQLQPADFLPYVMTDMLAKEKNLDGVQAEVLRRLGELAAEAGGRKELEENLARLTRPALTLADLYRQIRRMVLAEQSGFARMTPEQIEQRFHPRWYGPGRTIAASAAGSDFTKEDVANFLLLEGCDEEVESVLKDLIIDRILLAEVAKMGSNTEGLSRSQALEVVFAPLITERALREFIEQKAADFQVYKVREFLIPATLQAGQSLQAVANGADDLQKRAQKLAAQLKPAQGTDNTALLSTGGLRYYYRMNLPAGLVPPTAYGLDYLYEGAEQTNPLLPAPDWLLPELATLKAGTTTAPKTLPAGVSLAYCSELLPVRQPEQLLPAARRLRLNEQSQRLVAALTSPANSKKFWAPAARVQVPELVIPARPQAVKPASQTPANPGTKPAGGKMKPALPPVELPELE